MNGPCSSSRGVGLARSAVSWLHTSPPACAGASESDTDPWLRTDSLGPAPPPPPPPASCPRSSGGTNCCCCSPCWGRPSAHSFSVGTRSCRLPALSAFWLCCVGPGCSSCAVDCSCPAWPCWSNDVAGRSPLLLLGCSLPPEHSGCREGLPLALADALPSLDAPLPPRHSWRSPDRRRCQGLCLGCTGCDGVCAEQGRSAAPSLLVSLNDACRAGSDTEGSEALATREMVAVR